MNGSLGQAVNCVKSFIKKTNRLVYKYVLPGPPGPPAPWLSLTKHTQHINRMQGQNGHIESKGI